MLKRVTIVLLAFFMGMAAIQSHAEERITLTANDVTSVWRNINDLVMVLAANNAMDDEWLQKLQDMTPGAAVPADAQSLNQEMTRFQEQLNVLLTSSELDTIETTRKDAPDTPSTLYLRSGEVLDYLVTYLIDADTLASVALYYKDANIQGSTDKDLVGEVNLANQRLAALIEEIGI